MKSNLQYHNGKRQVDSKNIKNFDWRQTDIRQIWTIVDLPFWIPIHNCLWSFFCILFIICPLCFNESASFTVDIKCDSTASLLGQCNRSSSGKCWKRKRIFHFKSMLQTYFSYCFLAKADHVLIQRTATLVFCSKLYIRELFPLNQIFLQDITLPDYAL